MQDFIIIFAYDSLKEGQTPEMAVVTNQLCYIGRTITQEFVMRFDDSIANTIADIFEGFGSIGHTPFDKLVIEGIDAEDRKFIEKIMRLTPSQRPEDEQLMQDPWWTI